MMFNYEKALERFMGEKEILIEVLPDYLENLDRCINELKGIDPKTECDKIRTLAHSIKGSSLNLDIEKLGRAAEVIEDLAHSGNIETIPERIEQLVGFAAIAKKELEGFIG